MMSLTFQEYFHKIPDISLISPWPLQIPDLFLMSLTCGHPEYVSVCLIQLGANHNTACYVNLWFYYEWDPCENKVKEKNSISIFKFHEISLSFAKLDLNSMRFPWFPWVSWKIAHFPLISLNSRFRMNQ